MKKGHIYTNDMKDRAVSKDSLEIRLNINKKYQNRDFQKWLNDKLNVCEGEHILDVGCGTGAQALNFLKKIGNNGTVSCLDISEQSVKQLLQNISNDQRVEANVSDMAELENIINNKFRQKKYSLAHSSYALYYSPSRLKVLKVMANSIFDDGRVAIFTPTNPHGLVEIASRFSDIPKLVSDSLVFGKEVLEPEFLDLFWDVEIYYFQSMMIIDDVNDFMDFYRATTYFDKNAFFEIQNYANKEIDLKGNISYSKNGYLIIGKNRK